MRSHSSSTPQWGVCTAGLSAHDIFLFEQKWRRGSTCRGHRRYHGGHQWRLDTCQTKKHKQYLWGFILTKTSYLWNKKTKITCILKAVKKYWQTPKDSVLLLPYNFNLIHIVAEKKKRRDQLCPLMFSVKNNHPTFLWWCDPIYRSACSLSLFPLQTTLFFHKPS